VSSATQKTSWKKRAVPDSVPDSNYRDIQFQIHITRNCPHLLEVVHSQAAGWHWKQRPPPGDISNALAAGKGVNPGSQGDTPLQPALQQKVPIIGS
jgi:hypothetical protein